MGAKLSVVSIGMALVQAYKEDATVTQAYRVNAIDNAQVGAMDLTQGSDTPSSRKIKLISLHNQGPAQAIGKACLKTVAENTGQMAAKNAADDHGKEDTMGWLANKAVQALDAQTEAEKQMITNRGVPRPIVDMGYNAMDSISAQGINLTLDALPADIKGHGGTGMNLAWATGNAALNAYIEPIEAAVPGFDRNDVFQAVDALAEYAIEEHKKNGQENQGMGAYTEAALNDLKTTYVYKASADALAKELEKEALR